jgi:voltage-gated potassium channel
MLKSKVKRQIRLFFPLERFVSLIKKPVFWRLTIIVHAIILGAAAAVYTVESDLNPNLSTFTNTLYWSISTATSVGYGDVVPVTNAGKWVAMALMIAGTLFHALYTALFAAALMKPEIEDIEREIINEEKLVDVLLRRLNEISAGRTPV